MALNEGRSILENESGESEPGASETGSHIRPPWLILELLVRWGFWMMLRWGAEAWSKEGPLRCPRRGPRSDIDVEA